MKILLYGLLALALALSGCSGGDGDQSSSDSGDSEGSPQTSESAGQTTAAPPETTAEAVAPEETTAGRGDSNGGGTTALSGGLEEARNEAESWNDDAELYAIASLQPNMNAEGENAGWLYSFVSESEGSIISLPYRNGEIQNTQGHELPGEQIDRLTELTLPVEDLVDTPEAVQRSDEVRNYLEENPQAGASAGVDSASRDEPEWILSVPENGLQDSVSAVE